MPQSRNLSWYEKLKCFMCNNLMILLMGFCMDIRFSCCFIFLLLFITVVIWKWHQRLSSKFQIELENRETLLFMKPIVCLFRGEHGILHLEPNIISKFVKGYTLLAYANLHKNERVHISSKFMQSHNSNKTANFHMTLY